MTEKELAERVRSAVVDAALRAYEDAGVQGLCAEGRWEAAVDAMRSLALASRRDSLPPQTRGVKAMAHRTSRKSSSAARKAAARRVARKPTLLSGGNPRIAKADGAAPVRAYIAAMPGWKRGVGRRLDALVARHAPQARRAVKWNSPFYGIEGRGWFLSFHVFTRYVKVTFFRGTALRPVPPGGTGKDARWVDVHEDDFDEAQTAAWIRQAAALPGWGS